MQTLRHDTHAVCTVNYSRVGFISTKLFGRKIFTIVISSNYSTVIIIWNGEYIYTYSYSACLLQ